MAGNNCRSLVLAPVFICICSSPVARTRESANREFRLRLYHTHTAERIDVVYRQGGKYVSAALSSFDKFLRDHRTGEVHHFDPRLFDLLSDLTAAVGRTVAEINVIFGHRTPWSNNYLRRHSSEVAQHKSTHAGRSH